MPNVIIHPRREWTDEDDIKFHEFVQRESYDTFKLRVERMIADLNVELIDTKNLDCIPQMKILSTLLRTCDLARE